MLNNSPNSYVAWYELLKVLGIDVLIRTLPLRTTCPQCHTQTLRIFEDSKFKGGWHYCERCKSSGDMLQLALRVWKISDIKTAIRRLQVAGLSIPEDALTQEAISEYVTSSHAKRHQTLEFMKNAANNLHKMNDQPALNLLQLLNLDQGIYSPLWLTRMGKFLGSTTRTELQNAVHQSNHLANLTGRNWNKLLVIPFQNMPSRICGLYGIGRSGGPADRIYCGVPKEGLRPHTEGRIYNDPGLAMYDVLFTPTASEHFGNKVFVGPVVEAVRLQARHMQHSSLPLPILGTYNGTAKLHGGQIRRYLTYDSWKSHPDRQFVFWYEQLTADVFNMAARCNGYVVQSSKARTANELPIHRLLLFSRQAKPWVTALAGVLETASLQARIRLLQELDLPQVSTAMLYRDSNDVVRNLLDGHGAPEAPRILKFGPHRVVNTEAGWYAEPGQKLISTARLVIKRVLFRESDSTSLYDGEILFKGRAFPFLAPIDEVETRTTSWMQQQLMQAGAGVMQCDRAWSGRLVTIATFFHEPTTVKNAGRCGWQQDRAGFILPTFAIKLGGKVDAFANHEALSDAPGNNLPNPELVVPRVKGLLDGTLASELFWANAACIGANILAPAIGETPAGIALVGWGGWMAGRETATACGCCVAVPAKKNMAPRLTAALERHNWPLFIEVPKKLDRGELAIWLHDPSPRNVILEVDGKMASAMKLHSNWRFVHCDTPLTDLGNITRFGPSIMLAWLQNLCTRQLTLAKLDGRGLAVSVLADMGEWAAASGYDPKTIHDAAKWLEDTDDVDMDVAGYFGNTVCRLVDAGKLPTFRGGFEDPRQSCCTEHDGTLLPRGIFIPTAKLNRLLLDEGMPLLDPTAITAALAEAGVLVSKTDYHNVAGWLVDADWWFKQLAQHRKHKDRLLSVIG